MSIRFLDVPMCNRARILLFLNEFLGNFGIVIARKFIHETLRKIQFLVIVDVLP